MKTIEQLRAEASRYAINAASNLLSLLEQNPGIQLENAASAAANRIIMSGALPRMLWQPKIETALELAFLAGWQASRDGVQ